MKPFIAGVIFTVGIAVFGKTMYNAGKKAAKKESEEVIDVILDSLCD